MTAPNVRIEMPYKVQVVGSPFGSPTYNPRTRETRLISQRYFATMDEAIKFCGDKRRVKFAPGEAWRAARADEAVTQ